MLLLISPCYGCLICYFLFSHIDQITIFLKETISQTIWPARDPTWSPLCLDPWSNSIVVLQSLGGSMMTDSGMLLKRQWTSWIRWHDLFLYYSYIYVNMPLSISRNHFVLVNCISLMFNRNLYHISYINGKIMLVLNFFLSTNSMCFCSSVSLLC